MNCGCGCANEPEGGYAWAGSGLKWAVNMTCEGFSMDEDDWTITVTRGNKSIVFTPDNAIHEVTETGGDETSQWYICIDSSELGPGEMYIIFDAFVPDEDFDSGIRHEIQKYRLITVKSL